MSQKTREKYGIRLPVMVDAAAPAHKFDSFMIPAARKPEPVWNGLRRLWMLDGAAVDPQPAAPQPTVVFERAIQRVNLADGLRFEPGKTSIDAPPAVKVSA